MPTASAVTDPMRLDALIQRSSRATHRAAPGPLKQYGRTVGVSISRASRHKSGDPHGPSTRNLIYIDQLARGEHTSPYPQIVEEIAVAKRADFEGKPTALLEARLRELIQGEHDRQARQDRGLMVAAITGDYSEVADAVLPHADSLVEISVLAEEITERKKRGQA